MRHVRPHLPQRRLAPARALATLPNKSLVVVAGLVQSRQRPGTASGVVFVTLEDETGSCNVVFWSSVFERHRLAVTASRIMLVSGVLERAGDTIHVIADRAERVDGMLDVRSSSRDFH